MAKIDLAMAKAHLKAVEGTEEDALIEAWIKAAYLAVEGEIFRSVLDADPPEPVSLDDEVPLGPNARSVWAWEDINAAALLILGHLFVNRESVVQGQAVEVPMGAVWLLKRYVNYSGGA